METIQVTRDIVLEFISIDHTEEIFQLIDSNRDFLCEWLPFVNYTQAPGDTQKFISAIRSLPIGEGELVWVVYYKNQICGLIGTARTDKANKKTEIGYWLGEKFQKKGIITQSAKAIINILFTKRGFNRICLKCGTENIPSAKIAEKLNFTLEGIERDGELLDKGFIHLKVYSLLKKEWRQ